MQSDYMKIRTVLDIHAHSVAGGSRMRILCIYSHTSSPVSLYLFINSNHDELLFYRNVLRSSELDTVFRLRQKASKLARLRAWLLRKPKFEMRRYGN